MILRRKIILIVFVSLFLLSLAGMAYLGFYFESHCPRSPRPETGNIYREVANKTEVYLTRREMIVSRTAELSSAIWFAVSFYFGVRWKFVGVATRAPKLPVVIGTKKQKKKFGR